MPFPKNRAVDVLVDAKKSTKTAVVKYRMLENSLLIEPKERTPRRIRDINI
jgi:hypothetical protein